MTATVYCAAGCVVKGAHLPDCGKPCGCHCHDGPDGMYPCDVPGGCYANHRDGPCPGCRPALADRGLLCLTCRARIAHALTLAPALITHIRAHVPPGRPAARRPGDGPPPQIRHAVAAPVPLNLGAIDAADRVYAELVSWTATACDDLHLTGPEPGPAWRTSRSSGQVAGLPPGSDGAPALTYARWLLTHLDQITARPWVTELLPGPDPDPDRPSLVTLITWTERAWPMEDRPTWLGIPCPNCDLKAVRHRPPAGPGLPAVIACTNCGHPIPEELWDWEARKVRTEREAADAARAAFGHTR